MDLIRCHFRSWDTRRLSFYEPFPPIAPRGFGKGGLTDIVAAVNSLIAGAAVVTLAVRSGSVVAVSAAAVVVFGASFAVHAAWLEHRYLGVWLPSTWRRALFH